MKLTLRHMLTAAALACFSTLMVAALADNSTPPARTDDATVAPTAAVAAAAPASPEAATASGAATTLPASDAAAQIPVATEGVSGEPASAMTATGAAATAPAAGADMPRLDQAAEEAPRQQKVDVGERVVIFGDAHLRRDERGDAVVAVFGSATAEGDVHDAVVSIFGNTRTSGRVGDAAVAVFGNTRVTGPVGDAAVAVFGNVYVNSEVSDVVAVLGSVELGPKAVVRGDVVPVGGTVKRDPGAVVRGQIPVVGVPFLGFGSEWLQAYLTQCVYKIRPLAIGPHLAWAWLVAIGFLSLYALLALLFRGGMEKTVATLESRPGGSILAALLTVLLMPVLFVLLSITVVGIAVIPFLGIGLVIAGLFGKAAMLAWIGRRITRLMGETGPLAHPAVAVLIGGVIVLGLYLVPVLGFIVYKTLGVLGTGVVVYTLLLASKREKRPPAPVAVSMPAEGPGAGAATPGEGVAMPGEAAGLAGAAGAVATEVPPAAAAIPPVALATLPRAGFWIRIGALAIDGMLMLILMLVSSGVFNSHVNPGFAMLLLAGYGAVLWKLKGSTIGGIVCGLRVVRLDGQPVDWATAIVRALACFLSLFAVGLGFIWVAIDDDKQSWHDKIAGTVVVHARGGLSLI